MKYYEGKMDLLICIDDTDMPGTKGTGWLAQDMCRIMAEKGMGIASPISRHQLFVHEDVPYTSHNSAMCFEMALPGGDVEGLIRFVGGFLKQRSEPGSDPGLCVAASGPGLDRERLAEFGQQAKQAVLSKSEAYDLARETGVHLSEHGGTGQGVVGALAGVGLRLTGNDGRYRGWYHLGLPGDVVNVGELCEYPFIEQLVTRSGTVLSPDMQVRVGSEKTKTVRLAGRQVVVVQRDTGSRANGVEYRTLTKDEAKQY